MVAISDNYYNDEDINEGNGFEYMEMLNRSIIQTLEQTNTQTNTQTSTQTENRQQINNTYTSRQTNNDAQRIVRVVRRRDPDNYNRFHISNYVSDRDAIYILDRNTDRSMLSVNIDNGSIIINLT